jgi:hypothetical protein
MRTVGTGLGWFSAGTSGAFASVVIRVVLIRLGS